MDVTLVCTSIKPRLRTQHPQQLRPHAFGPQPPGLLERRALERREMVMVATTRGVWCAYMHVYGGKGKAWSIQCMMMPILIP